MSEEPRTPRQRFREAVWASSLSPSQRLVALCFEDHAKDGPDNVWVALSRLQQRTGLARDTCVRAVKALRTAGWLCLLQAGHQNYAARYRLAVPVAQQSDGRTSQRSDGRTSQRSDGRTPEVLSGPMVRTSGPMVSTDPRKTPDKQQALRADVARMAGLTETDPRIPPLLRAWAQRGIRNPRAFARRLAADGDLDYAIEALGLTPDGKEAATWAR